MSHLYISFFFRSIILTYIIYLLIISPSFYPLLISVSPIRNRSPLYICLFNISPFFVYIPFLYIPSLYISPLYIYLHFIYIITSYIILLHIYCISISNPTLYIFYLHIYIQSIYVFSPFVSYSKY